MSKTILCLHGGICRKPATEWRCVPFTTVHDAVMVAAYCAEHLREADSMGAKRVVATDLPSLSKTPTNKKKRGAK